MNKHTGQSLEEFLKEDLPIGFKEIFEHCEKCGKKHFLYVSTADQEYCNVVCVKCECGEFVDFQIS